MVLEAQILHYYLKVFSFLLFFIIYLIYVIFIRETIFKNEYLIIKKSESYKNIIDKNINDFSINLLLYKLTLKILLLNNIQIHMENLQLMKILIL